MLNIDARSQRNGEDVAPILDVAIDTAASFGTSAIVKSAVTAPLRFAGNAVSRIDDVGIGGFNPPGLKQLELLNPNETFIPNPATLNKVTAYDFLTDVASKAPKEALLHMEAIDFTKAGSAVEIPYGTVAQQFVNPRGVGNYFSGIGATELEVGIEQLGRDASLFQSLRNTKALQSVTRPDYVFPPGDVVAGSGAGGAIQYYVPDKSAMIQILR